MREEHGHPRLIKAGNEDNARGWKQWMADLSEWLPNSNELHDRLIHYPGAIGFQIRQVIGCPSRDLYQE